MNTPIDFPIMSSKLMASVPWAFLEPHEAQALRNHSQSLKRLAERGGLAPCEAIDIVKGLHWNSTPFSPEGNARELINMVREWRAKQPEQGHE